MIDKDTVITGRKQAVVFIHGQGEQIPMETLTEFVDSVWVTDPKVYSSTPDSGDIKFNAIWGKPDSRNKSHELRRITTTEADNGYRTDFFSFYWADLMRGNTWQHFTGWLAGLLWRWPKRVPSDVMPVWIFLWLLTIAVLIFTINKLYPIHTILNGLGIAPKLANWFEEFNFFWFKFISVIITAVGYIGIRKLTLSFGDAARYTTAKPNNIGSSPLC